MFCWQKLRLDRFIPSVCGGLVVVDNGGVDNVSTKVELCGGLGVVSMSEMIYVVALNTLNEY